MNMHMTQNWTCRIRESKSLLYNFYKQIAQKIWKVSLLCNGDETHESWKPLLNTIHVFRGSLECFAQ